MAPGPVFLWTQGLEQRSDVVHHIQVAVRGPLGVGCGPRKTTTGVLEVSMYAAAQPRRTRFAKALAFGLAILSLVFFLQIVAHGHNDSRQDGACRVCQLAHIGMAPAVAAVTFAAPMAIVGDVAAEVVGATTQDSVSESSPRAPPSSNA